MLILITKTKVAIKMIASMIYEKIGFQPTADFSVIAVLLTEAISCVSKY